MRASWTSSGTLSSASAFCFPFLFALGLCIGTRELSGALLNDFSAIKDGSLVSNRRNTTYVNAHNIPLDRTSIEHTQVVNFITSYVTQSATPY